MNARLAVRRRVDVLLARLRAGAVGGFVRDAVHNHHHVFGPDPERVVLGENVVLNDALLNCVSGRIVIERDAFFGHGVSLLTGTHDVTALGLERQRRVPAEGRDIVVGEGAWIASNVTILGPCRIGAHAVVAAGAVVLDDVPAYTIVGGVPARRLGTVEQQAAFTAAAGVGLRV